MRKQQNVQEQDVTNSALLNVITPVGLEFQKNSLSIGENIGKIYGLIRYPQKVDAEWLSKITNIPATIVSIGFKPVDNATLISAISRSVVQQRGFAEGAKDPLSRQRAEKAAEELAEAKPAEPAKQPSAPKRVKSEQGIIVEGLDNCLVKFSKCCTPVPGDDIIGFITRGYGVSVHRCDCPNASEEKRSQPGQEGRWIKVSWGGDTNDSYPTILEVVCKDRQGLLLDISAALSTTNTFVLGINSRSTEDQFAIFRLEIRVKDGAQLKSVMNKLNQISGVLKVNRPAG